jgi:tRNA 2-thiouridine synthesizing protein A
MRQSCNRRGHSEALWHGGLIAANVGARRRHRIPNGDKRQPSFQSKSGDLAVNFDKELDARGLSCPLPILKTKKALNDLASGQVLRVVATDPGSVKDMEAFANQTGNALLSSTEENKTYVFFMKKK